MSKIWVKQVKATRPDGLTSTVDFINGLNCVIGPSNTGKTRIAKTISYVCGGDYKKEKPFTQKTGYTTAYATFVTKNGEVTLAREVKPRAQIKVTSTDPGIQSGTYSASKDSKNPINTALLQMLGIDPNRKIFRNETFTPIAFTWRSIWHLINISEKEIDRDSPTILFHDDSNQTLTATLSMLLVMIQDEHFEHERQETNEERRQRRRAVENFIYRQLDVLQPQIEEASKIEETARKQGITIDAYLRQLKEQLESVAKQQNETLKANQQLIKRLAKVNKELTSQEVLVAQRTTLVSQYSSDISRLSLQKQAMTHDKEHPHPATCQFCNSQITAAPPSEAEIKAVEAQIVTLRNCVTEPKKT